MLVRVWVLLSISTTAWTQQTHTHTRLQQGDATFEWGWQQQQTSPDATVGHYYVKLPQSEQRVQYSADSNGHHGTVTFNAGDQPQHNQALFTPQVQHQAIQSPNVTYLQPQGDQPQAPIDIYLLQQQYAGPAFVNEHLVQPYSPSSNIQYAIPHFYNPSPAQVDYSVQTLHTNQRNEGSFELLYENDSSNPLQKEDKNEQHDFTKSVVQVFKDHNCTDDVKKKNEETTKLIAQVPSKEGRNVNGNFGAKSTQKPLTYKGAVNFKVESPRENARSEKYFYTTTDSTPITTVRTTTEDERISRLVASTQDLISNEDLLKINHAAEKNVNPPENDLIKPRPRFQLRAEQSRHYNDGSYNQYQGNYNQYPGSHIQYQGSHNQYQGSHNQHQGSHNQYQGSHNQYQGSHNQYQGNFNQYLVPANIASTPRSRITVKAKIGNIVDSEIEHIENNESREKVLQSNANEYKFASPIVVQDTSYDNYKKQIVNNLVSTMVPYIEKGYEIVGVRDSSDENFPNANLNNNESNENLVNVTPRPIGQKYLAPITVALRLLNANDTESFNTIDDHETSDSEISEAVEKPKHERTVVEVQESIPVSITHINDIEVHDHYLEEGRANTKGPLDYAKSLYNKYMEVLESARNAYNSEKDNDLKDNLEPSENVQTEVEVKPNDSDNERKEYIRDYQSYGDDNHKIIQPIIIEKEVPVTQFVDRYIEKPVTVHERVQVPVDRPVPVAVPVEKIVDRPVEVTRYVNRPYPVEVPRPYPFEVKVPYPVQQKVYIDRPIHVPYPVEKLVERQILHPVPVPTPVAIPYEIQVPVEQQVLYPIPIRTPVPVPVEVEKPVHVEKIVTQRVPVPYPVEKKVPYPVPYETKVPVPYAVERKVPYPVDRVVEKPVPVTQYIEKPIHIQVPVPQPVAYPVRVPQPYPVDRVVEKKVPYPVPVDRVVEKKVPVQVPVPVEKVVEKVVEKPVVVTKYVDKPYPVEKRVPYPVEKIVEKKVPYPVPVHVPGKVPYSDNPYAIYHYGYGHVQNSEGSQYQPQYIKYTPEQHKQLQIQKAQAEHLQNVQNQYAQVVQYYQDMKDKQQKNVQTTHWGNLYASSYQHINNSPEKYTEYKKNPALSNYINYVTNHNSPNNQNSQSSSYYGPPPVEKYNDMWEKNKNYIVELKLRRTDRQPKMGTVRIEYGGFKPPLIPSTEVDLDGIPVNKDGDK